MIRDEKMGVDFLLQILAMDGVEAVTYPVGSLLTLNTVRLVPRQTGCCKCQTDPGVA